MISIEEASRIILDTASLAATETCDFHQCLGRTLAQHILADTDLPPFHRVMMDGIAIRLADFMTGVRAFELKGIQRAGGEQQQLPDGHYALEIMTGAVLPHHADVVIPYEEIEIINDVAHVKTEHITAYKNVHLRGTDKKQGDVLVHAGTTLSAMELAIAASCGATQLSVRRLPRIHIFSTGDELVEPSSTPLPHQIRRSNVYALQFLLQQHGYPATQSHIADNDEDVKAALQIALSNNDVVILTGGVSKGKYDLIPEALASCGVEKLFHRIAQRPGKPMYFGKSDNTVVFALPGNPVSTFMCAVRYLLPFLAKCSGHEKQQTMTARLTHSIKPHPSLTFFAQVQLQLNGQGQLLATPVSGNGSGDYSSLAYAHAFAHVTSSEQMLDEGSIVEVFPFKKF
jgi:molybdopterin molybdotransferase